MKFNHKATKICHLIKRLKKLTLAKIIFMPYFNYHAKAKSLIAQNKLVNFYFTKNHNGIKPALVLVFNDPTHPIMPIRRERWQEYLDLIKENP